MKKIFLLFTILFPILCYSQEVVTMCPTDMSQYTPDSIPNYTQTWWNGIRYGYFAVVYVDFPDGRYISGNDTLQPFYDYQLEWVNSHGEPDAAGEMGLINEPTNIPVGNKFMKASKYTWNDRWNMFFDSVGAYTGTAHPDWASHGDSAWGSMKQYWKEASNGKFEMVPYLTHPNETDYKLRTGIINGYQMVNGVRVIKCLKLPKKKYGSSSANSYLRGYNINDSLIESATDMISDTRLLVQTQLGFNLNQFISDGGILFIYFAGSHGGLKDIGYPGLRTSVIRLREGPIQDPSSKIDGFGVSAHQFGHFEFGWAHTNAGRCDIMNGGDVHDNNSPQFPNPIYRMQQGWLQPIAMDSTQQIGSLPPIETSYKCGVVTMYGKPSAAADWSTGESFVVENRRRLNFDRKIVDQPILNQYPYFKGGLLVWHYSPYYPISTFIGGDSFIKFHSADTNSSLFSNRGNPRSFYAYAANYITEDPKFYNFDTSKSHSGVNARTGIELKDIDQNNYNNLSSTMKFKLNYLISKPKTYDYVIYPKAGVIRKVTLSGNVFYHNYDDKEYYSILPGAKIDLGGTFKARNTEAKGTLTNPVIFNSPGYSNNFESHFSNYNKGLYFTNCNSFSDVDTLVLDNVNIENVNPGIKELSCILVSTVPVILQGIKFNPNFLNKMDYDVELLTNSNIVNLNLSNAQILARSSNNFGEVSLKSSRVTFYGNIQIDKGISLNSSVLDNLYNNVRPSVTFDKKTGNVSWEGINIVGGGIDLNKSIGGSVVIKNAMTGIDITDATGGATIQNARFENNLEFDILMQQNSSTRENPLIKGNTFIQTTNNDTKIASIVASECPFVIIDSNSISNPGYFGMILVNDEKPYISKNTIVGGNSQINSTGISSYNSNGLYRCNEISQFTGKGIELDDSQPILFNNNIFVNGLGLFLTNNSNPIMEPSYTQDKTFILSGYNWIHHNSSEEIYCNNSKYYSSTPLMFKGNNFIEDASELVDVLIFNQDFSGSAPTIDCPANYWGGGSPQGRLIPDYSFRYDPYLTQQLAYSCDFITDMSDNSSMPEDQLLLGNILLNQYEGNYNNALNYSNQLLGLTNSNISPVISLNNLFSLTFFSNGNFTDLENYYSSFTSQNSSDTVLSNVSKNLAIESKLERNEIEPAILDYENIINTSDDEEMRFYASINRSRAIILLIDSLLSHGGDNISGNMDLEKLYDKAINYSVNRNSLIKKQDGKLKDKMLKGNGTKNPDMMNKTGQIHFPVFQKSISDKIKNFNSLNENEKRALIIEKNILDIAENNYVNGIASLNDKLQFLNHGNNLAPKTYELYQNFPNPFNPSTKIRFEIPRSEFVKIKIFDLLGREVFTLLNEFKAAGTYVSEFDGTNFPSGIYFYKIESGDFVQVKKMLLVK